MSSFDYHRAASTSDAVRLLQDGGPGARVLAGGQSLMPLVNLGLAHPALLIDIGHLGELREISAGEERLSIGACATYAEVLGKVGDRFPLLAQAIRNVGNPRVRNMGTLGGAVAHADPSAEVPLALCVLEAEYEAAGPAGTRRIAATEFAQGHYETVLSHGEILIRIEVPEPDQSLGWGFHEYSRRAGDFALVAATATARCVSGEIAEARVGLAGVGGTPVRCRSLEASAIGTTVRGLDELAGTVMHDIAPEDDPFVSGAYRAHLARVLAIRALKDACRMSQEVAQRER